MADELEIEAQRNPSWREFLQGRYSPPAKKSLLDREIELASSIVVPSNFAKQSFIERGVDPSRLHVISLGATSVDPALHDRPGGFRPSQKRGSALRVLFAGQVNQRKGISYLLEAVANLGKHVAELEIIGPSTERMRERLQAYRENVVLSSPVPRRQLMQAMGHADVLVLPSLAEGFGLVALEAMAMGTPAVVTERTFGTDVITSGIDGWVVESGSAQALVKVLQSLADDRTLLAAAGVAAKSTATRFTWDRYARSAGEFLMTP
ncbi:glycosyltransferase family 4 protein [Curtobacterium sp. Leaf261]|uniref:glycosyltransferase family 4 protein n=1 Tax=Curtobacterium sp. Leaf261 TaxID=1736311 RepID=UPI00138F1500|nr:glycosyltransferase family 4 protein [Curtobacterium sp. Leaf261]